MKLFTLDEAVFSIKCYASAMLALYISYTIGLPRPFWAALTAYVVVVPHPWAGAVRSKAIFRLCGTVLGSSAVVYIVPHLSNYPVLMTAAMALWVGGCLYLSLLDRTPRAYIFMLAGYTAALVGFPSVNDPSLVFDTAVARVEEIGLGILCGALVQSIVLPTGIEPVIMRQLNAALATAKTWIQETLLRVNQSSIETDRRALAANITGLRVLSAHIPFESGHISWTSHAIGALQDNLVAATPLVSSIGDRLEALNVQQEPLPEPVSHVLEQVSAWLDRPNDASEPGNAGLRQEIESVGGEVNGQSTWRELLLFSLLTRLRELVVVCERGRKLRTAVDKGLRGEPVRQERRKTRRTDLHLDHGIALLSAFAALVAISLCCTFWYFTAWTNGSSAAMMAAVFISFFATTDNPVPFIRQFLTYTILSIPVSAVYLLAILPAIHSFEMLALTIFPVAFICGLFLQRPTRALKAMAFLFGVLGAFALQDTHTSDLVSFSDGMLGQVFGITMAAVVSAIIRTIGVENSVRRLHAANARDLAGLARSPGFAKTRRFDTRMLDRVGLLQARLAAVPPREGERASDALQQLRTGSDIAALQDARQRSRPADIALRPTLTALAQYFERNPSKDAAADEALLQNIDRSIFVALDTPALADTRTQSVVALVGIRRTLFPDAPEYRRASLAPD